MCQPEGLIHLWNSVSESFSLTCPSHSLSLAIVASPCSSPRCLAHIYILHILARLAPTGSGRLSENTLILMCLCMFCAYLRLEIGAIEWTGDFFISTLGWTKSLCTEIAGLHVDLPWRKALVIFCFLYDILITHSTIKHVLCCRSCMAFFFLRFVCLFVCCFSDSVSL